ncbi:MAG: hypothetical protein ACI8QZ_001312 [Chlamydiales bacterium]|jgi:hypothetical protein
MTDGPRPKKRLGCLILIGIALFVVLWATLGPTRGRIPTPVADAPTLPGIEVALAPLPAPMRGLLRGAARSVQDTAMRMASPFGEVTSVRARLVDLNGAPIAGASLRAEAFGYALEAISDVDGRLLLETRIVVSQVDVLFEARAPDGSGWRDEVHVLPGDATDIGDLCLMPGRKLEGRVVDVAGEPVSGAVVYLSRTRLSADVDFRPPGRFGVGPSVVSDGAGHFGFGWAPGGPLRVVAQLGANQDPDVRWGHHDLASFEEGQDAITLVLASSVGAARPLQGVVVDAQGQPMPFARIMVTAYGMGNDTFADKDGGFTIREVRDLLEVSARSADGSGFVTRLPPFPDGLLRLVLEPARTQQFTVQGDDGSTPGIISIQIFAGAVPLHRAWLPFARDIHRQNDGSPIELPVPNGSFHAVVAAAGYRIEVSADLDPQSSAAPVEFRLESLPVIEGRVMRAGEPVPGADVVLMECNADGGRDVMIPRPNRSTRTSDSGHFVLTPGWGGAPFVHTPGENWTHALVVATADGDIAGSEPIPLQGRVVRVDLELEARGAVAGQLVMSDNSSPAFWFVHLLRPSSNEKSVAVGADGRFRFETLQPGEWWVGVLGKALPSLSIRAQRRFTSPSDLSLHGYRRVVVEPGETTEVELAWQPAEVLRVMGTLRINGQPAAMDRVRVGTSRRLFSRVNAPTSGSTDRNGQFVLWLTGTESPTFTWTRENAATWTSISRPLIPHPDGIEVVTNLMTADLRILPGIASGTLQYSGTTHSGYTISSEFRGRDGIWTLPTGSGEIRLEGAGRVVRALSIEVRAGSERSIALSNLLPMGDDD